MAARFIAVRRVSASLAYFPQAALVVCRAASLGDPLPTLYQMTAAVTRCQPRCTAAHRATWFGGAWRAASMPTTHLPHSLLLPRRWVGC